MAQQQPAEVQKSVDEARRKKHRQAWDRTILFIALFCGIASWILVFSLFPGRQWFLRGILATLYVLAIEAVLLLLRKGLMQVYETPREIHTAIAGILGLFAVIAVNVVCHFSQQMAGSQLNPYLMEYLRWGLVVVPVAVMGLGIWLQSQDPEARRQALERRERGERTEFKTSARRDALIHPTMTATKTLIAEITAEAMAEEWIDEVRNELPAAVRARLDAKLGAREQGRTPRTYIPPPPVERFNEFVDVPQVAASASAPKTRANGKAPNAWQ